MPATDIESALRSAVSPERLQEHLVRFSTLFRDSGTTDEWAAAEYILEQMQSYGLRAEILSFDSLISWPRASALEVLDDAGNVVESLPARTRAFGADTPPGGLVAEVVFVPFERPEAGAMIFSHRAVAGQY